MGDVAGKYYFTHMADFAARLVIRNALFFGRDNFSDLLIPWAEISVAMQAGMGLGKLANVIHPYPTAAEAIRQCGDAYNRSRLMPTVKGIFHRLMTFTR